MPKIISFVIFHKPFSAEPKRFFFMDVFNACIYILNAMNHEKCNYMQLFTN
ncbi:hypothetical protein Hanom_Chr16g01471041 [Helianthus anomalus]